MRNIKFYFIFIVCLSSLLYINLAVAIPNVPQTELNHFIQETVKQYKLSPSYVRSILNRAHYNIKIKKRYRHPYEILPWYKYQQLFVTPERIKGGINYWDRANKLVAWEEKEYQVPGSIVLAIIGIESKYGEKMGNFRVLDTLTTLAFSNLSSRKAFYQKELGAFIAMTKTYKLNPINILGSYAGAMGQCQFMPTSYLYYAVDFHNNGYPNLFTDKADVIFSVGNYLRQHGWEIGQPIAIPAKVIGMNYRKILKQDHHHTFAPILNLRGWARYGVTPSKNGFNPNLKANLIKLTGVDGPEYWLIFHNFYVITTYNDSDLYAMAVFKLANKLNRAWHSRT